MTQTAINPISQASYEPVLSTYDKTSVDDVRIKSVRPLITPALLQEALPETPAMVAQVAHHRSAIADILQARDDRLLVVVGPCSIHDHDQAMEYARALKVMTAPMSGELMVVMRTYFEKPRTTIGWKGYINDPHLDGTYAINEGLHKARRLLLDVVGEGLPAGTEFLDLLSPQFVVDLIAWGAIGARTTESQSHRQLASGLSCPVGFKNGTDGGVQVAIDAMVAARNSHAFMGLTNMGQAAIFETRGNEDCHIILRGGKLPNFDAAGVAAAVQSLTKASCNPRLMVDASHANSQKQHTKQIEVAADVAARIGAGDYSVMGMMIESHLEEGRQDLAAGTTLRRGVSITDACISLRQTQPVLEELARAVAQRRSLV